MSEESATDTAIDLKKRSRRRLVGAAALALLAVIVLPIVMDSEPKPGGQEIQIVIPSQDSNSLAARLIPGHPAPPVSQLPPAATEAKPAPPALPPAPATKPVEPADITVPSQSAASPAVEKPKPEAAAGKIEEPKKTDAAHALAALEGKESDQWLVQLGAYQNPGNVNLLTGKLKDMGLPSSTEKVELPQGTRTRVRAGPFKSRDAAEKARLRIRKIGVDGSVVQK
jgi:DedD protein